MNKLIAVTASGLLVALAACSERERVDTGNDVEAAAGKIAAEAREAVNSPELKEVGSEIKEAAGDAGQVIKDTAKGAARGAREGAAKVEAETRDEAGDANRAAHDATH
ncbi:hypothetical protein LRS10_04250 [Phenylobacterium sp. J426]|uniref:hypothetical protein n=1 Tax=Phenylobacterium sp. J426 TaxID=2898439 RepID=UPI002151AD66|nr:hypothetical protein [Phenylobacterium sp. J426]MCR5873466.1 hypothetical protein [Phenylobacterium sp. J426]